ncbi:transmembrane protein 212 [Falco naumanni]|uniref:transmembrane protein 212 n=1 Tax=Falco naumanni TaxID=148594 RepID=UPI001ADE03D1|nr:transmembrane protein 212 [Falco naumanni]
MKVKGLYKVNRSILITFGVISIFSGILPFSPAFSYKLWFFGWSVCLASAICNGALVGRTNALSKKRRILLPFPYTDFPNLCRDPSHHEWYHLSLQIQDLCLSSAIFHASSGFVMTFTKIYEGYPWMQLQEKSKSLCCNATSSTKPATYSLHT